MHLKKIAEKYVTEPLQGWDVDTQEFDGPEFDGRIDLTDRFLSNFNKPLRRRMLFSSPETELPESLTFRHPGTQDVYILGQTRGDARGGKHYLNLTVCQLATDSPFGSSGLCQIYRKVAEGPADNPGWLVEQKIANCFIDLEFRTSANEAGVYEGKVENYFAFIPRNIQVKEWDFIELHGRKYRVVDVFADSGFSGLRVDKEVDRRVNFVAHLESQRVYDNVNHRWVTTPVEYNVTGILTNDREFSTWGSDSEPYIDVAIEAENIGFDPHPNKLSLELNGRRRVVTMVTRPPGDPQYTLRCK